MSLVVIAVATVAAIPLVVARMSRWELIRWPAQAYIEVFRGTPLLVQLIWVYFALPALLGIQLSAPVSVVIAMGGNLTAFVAEVYRAGLQAVPREHVEAGRVLGLSPMTIFLNIMFPQAWRQQIPALLNQYISIFKDTSLVAFIGVGDLTYVATVEVSQTFRPIEIYTAIAGLYFVIAFPSALLVSAIEGRMRRQQLEAGHPDGGSTGTSGAIRFARRLMPFGGR